MDRPDGHSRNRPIAGDRAETDSGDRPAGRYPRGLRHRWRAAFGLILAVVTVAVAGTTAGYVQVANHYRTAAQQLDSAISLSSGLTEQLTAHEGMAHALWDGEQVDRATYVEQQAEISRLFDVGLRQLPRPSQRSLLLHARTVWQSVLTSRGLWGPASHARPGVTAAEQQRFGADHDEVVLTMSRLTSMSIGYGSDDLASARAFQNAMVGLLGAMFAIALLVTVWISRRMTLDLVQPVEHLQRAVSKLSEGELEHQVALPERHRVTELNDLAEAFNAMARALDASHRDLRRRASEDSLTGLANRASFEQHLGHRCAAGGTDKLGVLFIDVDDFKPVNDSLGHAAGDELLAAAARRLSECMRPGDLVARLGGDEFAVMITSCENAEVANRIADRILTAFQEPFLIDGNTVRVAVSIGVSLGRADADAEALLAEADRAMYSAKTGGKGRRETYQRGEHSHREQSPEPAR